MGGLGSFSLGSPGIIFTLTLLSLLPTQCFAITKKQNAGLSDVFAYVAIFGSFFMFLKYLLGQAQKTIAKVHAGLKEDDFLKEYGYTWDYVFVFNVYDEDEKENMKQLQKDWTMKTIIDKITAAKMETKCFYSVQRDEIYVKVRCSPDRLKDEAQRIKYKCLLEKNALRVRANQGKKTADGKTVIWKPISLTDEFQQSSIQPYDFIYGEYKKAAEYQGLYTQYEYEGKKLPFRQVDRIKLMLSILQAPVIETPPGGGMNITELSAIPKGPVVKGQFPIQNFEELNRLQVRWLTMWDWPWNQPIDMVRVYFGERIGFYFLYLGHYAGMLMVPAALGAGTYILKCYEATPESTLQPYFTVFMQLWTTLFIEYWKQKQAAKALEWGMNGFESEEQDRPLFEGKETKSPINGETTKYFPSAEKSRIQQIVMGIIFSMIIGVICIVAGIFVFQWWVSQPGPAAMFTIQGFNLGSIIASMANAIVIGVLNALYGGNAVKLNDWENHRTDTEYEDALISKIFVFTLVNSFAALTYVSFIKYFLGFACVKNNCIGDVAATLSTIFLTALITRAINQVVVVQYKQHVKNKEESDGIEPGAVPSPLEEQYTLMPYDTLQSTLQDYAGLTINFGYTTLFVCAFPLAPTMSCVSAYIQIRIDGWKHCQAFQRPTPKSAEDIGVWQNMVEILGFLGVVYNFALLFFTSHYLVDTTWAFRWIMFIAVEHTVIVLKVFISAIMDDVPEEVAIQLERTNFLCGKVINDEKDDLEAEDKWGDDSTSNVIIEQTDLDYLPIMKEDEEEKESAL